MKLKKRNKQKEEKNRKKKMKTTFSYIKAESPQPNGGPLVFKISYFRLFPLKFN